MNKSSISRRVRILEIYASDTQSQQINEAEIFDKIKAVSSEVGAKKKALAIVAGNNIDKNLFNGYDKLVQHGFALNTNYKNGPKNKETLETYVNYIVDNGNKIVDELLDIEDQISSSSSIDVTWYSTIRSKYDSLKNLPLIKTITLPTVEVR
jgi:hypothetical protein